jgi:hypothetical protein
VPKGPRGEKRPADVIGNAVKVLRIARHCGYGSVGLLSTIAISAMCKGIAVDREQVSYRTCRELVASGAADLPLRSRDFHHSPVGSLKASGT